MSISLNGTTGLTFADASSQNTAATGFGFKNRIINGAMMIDQRNAGASVTVNALSVFYTVDRFRTVGQTSAGVFTVQRVADAPSGFINSAKITVTTADSSLAASDRYIFQQVIEGNNAADLGFGTTNASTVTISFWVKSSLTGTFGGCLQNEAPNRSYPFSYTISVANTWEYKTITIPGDTTGTWDTNNNGWGRVTWSLGSGSTTTSTANSWQAANYEGVTGQVQPISTLNATWQVTGVQLEKGSTATSFDYRPYGTELALCQRYCFVQGYANGGGAYGSVFTGQCSGSTNVQGNYTFPVVMRANPTFTWNGSFQEVETGATGTTITLNNPRTTPSQAFLSANLSSGTVTSRNAGYINANNSTSWYAKFEAEL